jgi:hypothetical protein
VYIFVALIQEIGDQRRTVPQTDGTACSLSNLPTLGPYYDSRGTIAELFAADSIIMSGVSFAIRTLYGKTARQAAFFILCSRFATSVLIQSF